MQVVYKGKHAELCKAIASGRQDDAMRLIYAFFRSEDNTDSYSIPALTVVRELLEDGDSEELSRVRIRMRSNGDKMMLTLVQFVWALFEGRYADAADILSEKVYKELPYMIRSMQAFAEEEGLSQATLMAGLRIRESMRLLASYFEAEDEMAQADQCVMSNLDMTRIFLFMRHDIMSEDMILASHVFERQNKPEAAQRLCEEIVSEYGNLLECDDLSALDEPSLMTLSHVGKAMAMLNAREEAKPYSDQLLKLEKLLGASIASDH